MSSLPDSLIDLSAKLSDQCDGLKLHPSLYKYNPLAYAGDVYKQYINRFALSEKRALFVGINPGPWGMAQTGVPFGEVNVVRDWLKLQGKVGQPQREHPRYRVQGFECKRSEVSGRRLWRLFRERFKTPDRFFEEHLIINYCPLMLIREYPNGHAANLTPDKLRKGMSKPLFEICDEALLQTFALLKPDYIICIGRFIEKQIKGVFENGATTTSIASMQHPSPANPKSNKGDYATIASNQLIEQGVW